MKNLYDYITNISIFDGKTFGKGSKPIGILSNQGADPKAPYYDDLFIQELDTGADTFQFTTVSNSYTQDLLKIGNVVTFHYTNRLECFTITSLEYSHYEGYKTISVYAEGIGFELLEIFMEKPEKDEDEEDKKYPNNIYIDENGNIIYDPHGNYEYNEDKITIDGNGNIIYNPSTNKKKNNDSLEFKNISYPTFLNVLLKNTGWEIVCQPGLESVKANISVRYDTNIYAILQDSMQAFGGVELEFVHEGITKTAEEAGGEFYNTPVYKKIKAYKNGGRGSFVGKRFEYGKNVRGITKTQQVTNEDDDTVLYVDGTEVGIEVNYDIDFALKSTEIPEIEIGDTHYVIDNDFNPPMTIKARIGRIEVSFSDLTKNKITVANNKKIRGSIIDEEEVQSSVKDLDNTISDTIGDTVIDDSILDDYFGDDYFDNYATMDYVDSAIEAAQLGNGGGGGGGDGDFGFETDLLARGLWLGAHDADGSDVSHGWLEMQGNYNGEAMRLRLTPEELFMPSGSIYCEELVINPLGTGITFSDGTTLTSANGLGGGGIPSGVITYSEEEDLEEFFAPPFLYLNNANVDINQSLIVRGMIFSPIIDTDDLYADKINGEVYNNSDKSLKENIRYMDDEVAPISDDLLGKADLHDFIVNQVKLCEYNYIGKDSDKIGFIANDYEGTKVGDKIVSRGGKDNTLVYDVNNLLFATIGALQEEVRMRDEKIATLEDRLAKIEEMLGINNK